MATQTAATGRTSDQFPLRLPEGMRDRLRAKAAASGRTMNAEIVDLLEHALGLGRMEGAASSYRNSLETVVLWVRLRNMAEAILRVRDLQESPDELRAHIQALEAEATATMEETRRLDEVAPQFMEELERQQSLLKALAGALKKKPDVGQARA